MKAIINGKSLECYPTNDEVRELCRPGEGADTCIWLSMGLNGLECWYCNRPDSLEDMWRNGETTAKRDGCDKMKQFARSEHKGKDVNF